MEPDEMRLDSLCPSQKGVWAEAVAMAWFIARGWEVFQGVGNTSCDLIVQRDGVTKRVEVKRASVIRTTVIPTLSVHVKDDSKYDILVVIDPDGQVMINPTWESVKGIPRAS